MNKLFLLMCAGIMAVIWIINPSQFKQPTAAQETVVYRPAKPAEPLPPEVAEAKALYKECSTAPEKNLADKAMCNELGWKLLQYDLLGIVHEFIVTAKEK